MCQPGHWHKRGGSILAQCPINGKLHIFCSWIDFFFLVSYWYDFDSTQIWKSTIHSSLVLEKELSCISWFSFMICHNLLSQQSWGQSHMVQTSLRVAFKRKDYPFVFIYPLFYKVSPNGVISNEFFRKKHKQHFKSLFMYFMCRFRNCSFLIHTRACRNVIDIFEKSIYVNTVIRIIAVSLIVSFAHWGAQSAVSGFSLEISSWFTWTRTAIPLSTPQHAPSHTIPPDGLRNGPT